MLVFAVLMDQSGLTTATGDAAAWGIQQQHARAAAAADPFGAGGDRLAHSVESAQIDSGLTVDEAQRPVGKGVVVVHRSSHQLPLFVVRFRVRTAGHHPKGVYTLPTVPRPYSRYRRRLSGIPMGPRGLPLPPPRVQQPQPSAPSTAPGGMEWRDILELLQHNRGPLVVELKQPAGRPDTVQPSSHRQVFVEAQLQRRLKGGDRWMQGGKSCREHWINSHTGVRCRTGCMRPGGKAGGRRIKFCKYTRVRYDVTQGQIIEERSPIAYVLDPDVQHIAEVAAATAAAAAAAATAAAAAAVATENGLGDALERFQLEQLLRATAVEFEPALVFDGARDGYVFKLGPRGNGYYLDALWKR
jgi:hypothetical protein